MVYKRFEELPVWKLSIELSKEIYKISLNKNFRKDFVLKNQICRASISISSNIAEGFERASKKEFIQFLYIAKGSAAEVRTQLYLAFELNYIIRQDFENLLRKSKIISQQLGAFIVSIKNKIK
ncbi:MAG: four helix bundle protein [Elusimicrobia bacterium]|nr:four helix bundle protein [Elusimicrobiota bacterium]